MKTFAIFAKKLQYMRNLCILLTMILMPAVATANNDDLLNELDSAIAKRDYYMKAKEERISLLKKTLTTETDSIAALKTLETLFTEYHVYKLDSAMAYAKRGQAVATRQGYQHFITLFTIHLAEILNLSSLYSEAVGQLDKIQNGNMDDELLFKYYYTYFSVYSYWSDYCHDQDYSPQYRDKANNYLELAMNYADKNAPLYNFYLGEKMVYVEPDQEKAREKYLNILASIDKNSRIYAMASYALAGNYRMSGDEDKYEEYLIRAAMSDIISCTMENAALQSLAVKLFEKGEDYIERAERYINISMEDAKFYNNRLRIIETSKSLPQIMKAYQDTTEKQNRSLRNAIFFILLLMTVLLFTAFFINRQNKKLSARRRELAENNRQLSSLNEQLAESNRHKTDLNEQLKELNTKLVDTNDRRETLASIFIDLCAKYIDKLGKYQTLVKRKIKANQAMELLQNISSTRISEDDAATFLQRFDKAFLELYPTFVEDFNALLTEDGRIVQKSPHTLTTELRTFALIRLGVKNTSDIAGLLFLSNQTIYNCRSLTKNKALNKETFDIDVTHLCKVIH